ncbi:MAG: hypothetical protein RLZZ267_449, partial [Bacillota bacterium]
YAMDDQVPEMDFDALVRDHELDGLFDNCSDSMEEPPEEIVHNQIDMALDLMGVAEMFGDTEWQEELKTRLKSLARRQMEMHKENSKMRPRLA